MVAVVECGLTIHVSPICAARRIARSLLAATHTGGEGRCTGRMFIRTASSRQVSPWCVTESSVHSRRTSSRHSTMRATRLPFGTPNASNSTSR